MRYCSQLNGTLRFYSKQYKLLKICTSGDLTSGGNPGQQKYRVFFQTDIPKITRNQNCKDKWKAKKCKKQKKKGKCKKKKVAKKCKKTCEKCPTIPCPGDTIPNGDGNCVCPGNTIDYGNGNCSCPGDTVIDEVGHCSCLGDTVNDGLGTCSCPENTMNDGDGNCFPTNGKEITLILRHVNNIQSLKLSSNAQ